ncbi:MAG TPA: PASTA domain-containing protein [Solirubrobacterales bacterium]|nr:PASTA domain-containing protein [Solirubrobacterales bacterium]
MSLEGNSHRRAGLATIAVVALLGLLAVAAFAPSAQARVESFQALAPSTVELTAFTADPGSGLMYAQEQSGTKFFRYDPRTNAWTELPPAPIDSGNNGGAAFLNGKIYVVYTGNATEIAVYDIASNSWTTIDNPLAEGTGNIVAGNGRLYLVVNREFVAYNPVTQIPTTLADAPEFAPADCGEGFEKWGGLQVVGGKIYGHQGDGCTGFAVYDIAGNSWQELPYPPEVDEEGPLLGSAFDPVTNTYITYGPYGGKTLYRFDIEAGSWTTGTLPFEVDDGGMAYLALPGLEGVYMIQGEEGTGFTRYTERNQTDLAPTMAARIGKGGLITYSIHVANNGPERASGIVLSNPLAARTKLVSAVTSLGTCGGTTVLTCDIGLLRSGASADLTIKLKAPLRKVTNTVTLSSQAVETNAGNDSAQVVSKQCVVPKLKTRKLKAAKKALRKANCKPGKVSHRFSGKPEGKVIRGSKSRGKVLRAGSKVKLVVSSGPKPSGQAKTKKAQK